MMDYLSSIMADIFDKKKRSEIMSRIKGKDTKPEIRVRRLLHAMGYRFRLHRKDLPGRPDIVLPRWKAVIFVHGCFWHLHEGCKIGRIPKSNRGYWKKKLLGNKARDAVHIKKLERAGYRCLVVWECETNNLEQLEERLAAFLPR